MVFVVWFHGSPDMQRANQRANAASCLITRPHAPNRTVTEASLACSSAADEILPCGRDFTNTIMVPGMRAEHPPPPRCG